MKKRGRRFAVRPPRLAIGCVARFERAKRVEEVAQPMRALFDLLAAGETYEIDGQPVMRLPDLDELARLDPGAEWVAIAPAILGWIDCWGRIAPDLPLQRMRYLAERLQDDKPVTPRLVEQARAEFEATISRLHHVPDDTIKRAIVASQIAWEFERMRPEAPNDQGNAPAVGRSR